MDGFVNRVAELAALQRWWNGDQQVAAVWGRRRVGKTALLQRFAAGRRTVFHAGARRGDAAELELLSQRVARELPGPGRSYHSWVDAFHDLSARTVDQPALLVLDDLPDLIDSSPGLATALAQIGGADLGPSRLKIVLSGASIRRMQALQQAGQPLCGVADLTLVLSPFSPHEAAVMLEKLPPAERARVYGIVGGMPLYLSWWDPDVSAAENLARLVCRPGAPLLTEGDLLLGTDLEDLGFNDRVLHALAAGSTTYNDVRARAGTEPARPLDRLVELRLIERVLPIGEARQARRRRYRIADPFTRFYLGVVSPLRADIDRGVGSHLAADLVSAADRTMGDVWQHAFRLHLEDLARAGELPVDGQVSGIGPWWDNTGRAEIDALALVDASVPALAGTATWEPTAEAGPLLDELRRKVERGLGAYPRNLRYAVCARDAVHDVPYDVLALTAADLFSPL